jgi:signal transduction histidine kinase
VTLTSRLLLGALAVIGVSLIVSGVLTGVLVRRLESETASQQLEKAVLNARSAARASGVESLGADPGGNRLLILTANGELVYDSEGTAGSPVSLHLAGAHLVNAAVVRDGSVTIGGQTYGAAAVAYRRGEFLVAARAGDAPATDAATSLVPRLLIAGGAALGVAIILALALARTISEPLHELAGAAEDVAAGNYARRVNPRGPAEVGVVASAFNRMAEAVERSRALQRDFLANVSHELKTPLTSLIGFSQALTDGSLRTEAEKRRAASILHEESQRLLRMSQELLDLARVEAGQVSLRRELVDVAGLLNQQLEVARPRAEQTGLHLELTAGGSLPAAMADPERVHQVLDNLLDNALKHAAANSAIRLTTSAGAGIVEVSCWNAVSGGAPDVSRMFERFYRGDPARARSGGVGLGLAISRELAQAMGGSLTADLTEGGVRLRLRLPAASP